MQITPTLKNQKKKKTHKATKRANYSNHKKEQIPKKLYQHIVQRKPVCACDGGCPRCINDLGIQAKLNISQPGDIYEQEADRIANQALKVSTLQSNSPKDEIQISNSKAINNPFGVVKRGGQPLPASLRAEFDPLLGYDFSRTRLHTDSEATTSTRMMHARAYTYNHHIVFGAGEYAPNTTEGQHLIIHELVHEMQQNPQVSSSVGFELNNQTSLISLNRNERINPINHTNSSSFIQRQESATTPPAPWTACTMTGPEKGGTNKKTNMDSTFVTKLNNICGKMKAKNHDTKIFWGYRTLADQVHIATEGRNFEEFKAFLDLEVTKGSITSEVAQTWKDYYDSTKGKHQMSSAKKQVTWTLNSKHRQGKAADVVHPTENWKPPEGESFWTDLKKIAGEEGLEIGPPAKDKAHVQVP